MTDAQKKAMSEHLPGQLARADKISDWLALEGLLEASEVIVGLRQTIRALWTHLNPPPTATDAPSAPSEGAT